MIFLEFNIFEDISKLDSAFFCAFPCLSMAFAFVATPVLRPTWNGAESSCAAGAMISAMSRFCRRRGDAHTALLCCYSQRFSLRIIPRCFHVSGVYCAPYHIE